MPSSLPIDLANFPSLRTRKALLVLDIQNEFLAPTGGLPVTEPAGFVDRTLAVARAFRASGSGNVFWIRSQFESHRPTADTHIITADTPQPPSIRPSSRSQRLPEDQDGDLEAFLSIGGPSPDEKEDRAKRFYPGSVASELLPAAASSIDARHDTVLAKTHYSAFQSSRLLNRLRTHFVTELYICGTLTNISVHATALDAARHGLALTLIEDCCGYRNATRHHNALASLVQLTGCDLVESASVIQTLTSPVVVPTPVRPGPPGRSKARSSKKAVEGPASLPVRTRAPASDNGQRGGRAEPDENVPGPSKDSKDRKKSKDSKDPTDSEDGSRTVYKEESQLNPSRSVAGAVSRPHVAPSEAKSADGSNAVVSNHHESATDKADNDSDESIACIVSLLSKRREAPQPRSKTQDEVKTEQTPAPIGSTILGSTATTTSTMSHTEPIASEPLCEGDTIVYQHVLPPSLEDGIYDRLCEEVHWSHMSHQGGEVPRLVSVQGDIDDDGNMPIYRHPADESPTLESFSPTVLQIKKRIEEVVGHPINHALIQLYRTGHDYISEHSDKTLDIVPGSYVCNVSVGAERTMIFRTKKAKETKEAKEAKDSASGKVETTAADVSKRQVCRVKLPHNSLCRVGLQTNMRWLHAIRQDKRMDRDKSEAELAFGGGRVSLTFRQIGTFLNSDQTLIWGQGARSKAKETARRVVNGQTDEAVQMLKVFGTENHSADFDWKAHYGQGFDVLHMQTAARLFASGDTVADQSVQLMLSEFGLGYARGSMGGTDSATSSPASTLAVAVRFADRDGSVVDGVLATMLYLDSMYRPANKQAASGKERARTFTRLQQALHLQDAWREVCKGKAENSGSVVAGLVGELTKWNSYASPETSGPEGFIAGGSFASLADFAFWPVLHAAEKGCGSAEALAAELKKFKLDHLETYYSRFAARDKVQHILEG